MLPYANIFILLSIIAPTFHMTLGLIANFKVHNTIFTDKHVVTVVFERVQFELNDVYLQFFYHDLGDITNYTLLMVSLHKQNR